MASIDHSIAPLIAHASTAQQAWDILRTTYANKSQSRIFGLREILSNLCHDSKPVANYMREIKYLADDLAASGSPLNNEELVIKVFSGLGSDYKELSVAICARDNPIFFKKLYDKLLAHEVLLKHSESKQESLVLLSN